MSDSKEDFIKEGLIEEAIKAQQMITVEKSIYEWGMTYDYYVAKDHRYDGAWAIAGILGVNARDNWGEPCETEEFMDRLLQKYNSSTSSIIEDDKDE